MMKTIANTGWKVTAAVVGLLGAYTAASAAVPGGGKKDEITFDLVPNPAVEQCLRANNYEQPRARATVIRGKLADTLILDLDGIKPGLAFDLFTVQRSPFLTGGVPDTTVKKGDFGLAWYQSDIEIGKHHDEGRVTIKTILLDQIFGFDPEVGLAPTNTFHLGFWFNNPEDVKDCNGGVAPPPGPFNGEHKAGPLAMISTTDVRTHLGPLCTDPNVSTNPISCDP